MQYLIKALEAEIQAIDEELLNSTSEQLSDYKRDRRIDEKRIYSKVVSFFTSAPAGIQALEEKLDENL